MKQRSRTCSAAVCLCVCVHLCVCDRLKKKCWDSCTCKIQIHFDSVTISVCLRYLPDGRGLCCETAAAQSIRQPSLRPVYESPCVELFLSCANFHCLFPAVPPHCLNYRTDEEQNRKGCRSRALANRLHLYT